MKPTRTAWPTLAEAWDKYGHMIKFDDLAAMKIRSDGCYVVCAWKSGDGYCVADLAAPTPQGPWEWQNDCSDELTVKQWRNLFIVRECDWWRIRGEAA